MKNIAMKYAAAAVFCALAFAGCAKMELPENERQEETESIGDGNFAVTFECEMAGEETETKTVFHDNTIWWGIGDQLLFAQWATVGGAKAIKTTKNSALTVEKQKMSMSISSFNTPDDDTEAVYFSVYPYSAYQAYTNSNGVLLPRITLPKDQTPKADGFDPASDILISDYVTSYEKETSLTLHYTRTSAIAKMSITGINSASPVTAVSFSAVKGGKAVTLAGSAFYDLQAGKMSNLTSSSCTKETQINLDYNNLAPSGDFTAYFNCYPFSLGTGDSFKVTVTAADGKVYEKNVKLGEGKELKFEADKGTRFTVNMAGAQPVVDWLTLSVPSNYVPTITTTYFGVSGSGIASVKYVGVATSEFNSITDLDAYVEANGTGFSDTSIENINNNYRIKCSINGTIDTEYKAVVKAVNTDGESVILWTDVRTDWFKLGAATRSLGGIQSQFYGVGLEKAKGYRIVPDTELEGVTDLEDYYLNTLNPGLNSTLVTKINEKAGAVLAYAETTDYHGEALVSGASYTIMIQVTNTRGETTFRSAKAAAK